ncbi:hypothetical protein [Kitasatospora sp. NPDC017646]|uniref:hypothetical protein n=1 Tax=Kitasatospora sp. NPDC017646 TaxID=3364024 RepID=UPI0037884FB5
MEGDDQKVRSGQKVPVRLKVRATDKDRKPVKGASIEFSTPGPGLKFPDGSDDATAVTDQDGYAAAPGAAWCGATGWSNGTPSAAAANGTRLTWGRIRRTP